MLHGSFQGEPPTISAADLRDVGRLEAQILKRLGVLHGSFQGEPPTTSAADLRDVGRLEAQI